jgi:hypothetical protein
VELAHGEAKRIAQPWQVDERLWAVWEEVARDLAADCTLDLPARPFAASKEQFRRVCLRDLGRSPTSYRE